MSSSTSIKRKFPSIFWTICDGFFLAGGIASIMLHNDYLWGIPAIIDGLFGLATMFLIKKAWCAQIHMLVASIFSVIWGISEIFNLGIFHKVGPGYVPAIMGLIAFLFIGLDKNESAKMLGIPTENSIGEGKQTV